MASLAPPSPRSRTPSPAKMPKKMGRRIERYCCLALTYFPLLFVLSLTTWAVWVAAYIGFYESGDQWWGSLSAILAITTYLLMNWSYLTTVFTSPGYTTGRHGYSSLPSHASIAADTLTVKSNGEARYCKKCQARKPDRAHHCSTCNTCVLKMDHHCPWVSNCVGLHNYKAFLLFLSYTTLFCFVAFFCAAGWIYREFTGDHDLEDTSLMPINYVVLAVVAGIIGLVLGGFTGWHISLAMHGQTTIECLEKTRFQTPARTTAHEDQATRSSRPSVSGGVHLRSNSRDRMGTRGDGGPDYRQPQSYEALERQRAADRYHAFLDEQDDDRMPSAFDMGAKRNFALLLGPSKLLWAFPICNTVGDGWNWETSPKWLAAREQVSRDREDQMMREVTAGWGQRDRSSYAQHSEGAGRHYVNAYPSTTKADRILGRGHEDFVNGVSMDDLPPRGRSNLDYEGYSSSDDDAEAERQFLDQKVGDALTRTVGVVSNAVLGNTVARHKDEVRGWDGKDHGVQ